MRSGFLNVVPSGTTALNSFSHDKGSRNKRKFRADPPSPLPLPVSVCNDCDTGRHIVNVAENGSESGKTWMTDCRSLEAITNRDARVGLGRKEEDARCCATTAHCSHEGCNSHPDHFNSPAHFNPGHVKVPYPAVKVPDPPFHCEQVPYNCEGTATSEIYEEDEELEELQEPDWDNFSEAQLEEILLNLLDSLYKDAIKKIMLVGVSEEEALKAVLRNGRCYGGRDAFCSVVDNALAYLKTSEPGTETRGPAFIDLKQMEMYVLAEMVCVLRNVRPFLSKGDAMWCLLMCDLNVAHACAMEDDALPSFKKDVTPPNLSSVTALQPTTSSGSSLSSVTETGISVSSQKPRLPSVVPQPSSCTVNYLKDSLSAFSVPSYTTSSGAAVSARCSSSGSIQSLATMSSGMSGSSIKKQQSQMLNSPSSDQLHFMSSRGEVHSLPSYSSECANVLCSLGTTEAQVSDQSSSNPELVQSLLLSSRTEQEKLQSASSICDADVQSLISRNESSLSVLSFNEDILKSDIGLSRMDCRATSNSMIQFPITLNENVETELQIGSSSKEFPVAQALKIEASTEQNIPDDASSCSTAGTELSLAISSTVDSGMTEVTSTGMEETPVCTMRNNMPANQFLDWTDADGEERKSDMLVQLVHRVKELEAQLQEWTEWAQQKVMQAARRLSKDTAELKALRAEREEYLRLKKENKAVEESTMKKLSEMEIALRKASSQVDRANVAVRRLESENAEVRAEMEAAKLNAAESLAICQEATRREKKSLKKVQGWEKQKSKLQEEIAEEKRKLSLLQQQLSQAKERQQQSEVRWRQEKKVKEEALLRADSEKRSKEQVETAAKRKEEALRRKAEADSQRYRDDIQRLGSEIAQLRMSSDPFQSATFRWGTGFGHPSYNLDTFSVQGLKQMNTWLLREIADLKDLSQRDVHRDRECVMCMNEEMSVVFLPCSHQVICVKCNELHEKQGLKDCPSCRTPIQQRICVYGVSS